MKNILVAVNFDDKTEALIDMASILASKFGSKIWIVHIAAPEPDFMGYDTNVDLQYINQNRAEKLRQEHRNIQDYAEKLKQNGFDTEALLIQGPTVKMILEEADKLHVDLIILKNEEHGFLYKLFLGSITPDIVRKSKIPVLVIP